MKTTHILKAFCGLALLATATSCNDWLLEESPGKTGLDDFFTSGNTAIQVVNACYTPLAWEFNSTYFSEWFIGDVVSDDALKGGQNITDMADVYDLENFKTNANNTMLLDFYRAQYQGIARCNLAIQEVAKVDADTTMTESRKNCLLGEAHFMRAYYYFRLVRVFGGVPYVDFVIDSSSKWQQPRASEATVYENIVKDLEIAEPLLWNKSEYADEDLGRATKGAAQAMLLKTYLYMGGHIDPAYFAKAYEWGQKFRTEQYETGEYSLNPNYADNFTMAGENGPESVFEIQYMAEPTSDYGEGFGFTRGTFTTILTRCRATALGAGWGFNHPTQNLYDEFETDDPRRDATIIAPEPDQLDNPEQEIYLGSRYYNRKSAYIEDGIYVTLDHATRSPVNYRLIRASDVLLMYAEAALESGKDIAGAKWALEEVRKRARGGNNEILPAFPGYNGYSDNTDDLRKAIRHERRVELAMEGHRWFDLCRWGIAYEVMDKDNGSYGKNETPEARAEMASFIKGKHELFPIPSQEINLNPMDQNPGY